MNANSVKVLETLKANTDKNLTAQDVADLTDIPVRSVNGIFTMVFQKHGLGARVEGVAAEGEKKAPKYLTLTDAGLAYIPEVDAE